MKMKPCAYCGSIESLDITSPIEEWDHEEYGPCPHGESYAVVCNFTKGGCGCTGGYRVKKDDAIEAWNRRAPIELPASDFTTDGGHDCFYEPTIRTLLAKHGIDVV